MDCSACHTPNVDGARFCQKCGAPLPVHGSEADPLIGQLVGGRYRVSEVIGEGGMGRVYVGEQQMGTTVRKVAIKTLLSQFAKDPQTVGRFMRECGTIAELEHPNTIKVYDYGQIEGSGEIYVAMEFLQGQSLEEALLPGPLPPERVDRILSQACGSLAEAHEKGIVHRDLKPANIFLTTRAGEEDVVKVLDFGIAKRDEKESEQKLTQQGTILGTPPYMSPEQFTGKQLDQRSDVYSLAVVTYEMLTGRLPFDADTPWEWATQHMTAQPFPFEATPMGSHVPAKMRNAVMRGMAKDREQRHQNVRDFFDDATLGSAGAPRLSMVGDRPPTGSMPGLPGPVTGSMAAGGRGGGTQIGEPAFAPAPPGGPTVVDGGAPLGGMQGHQAGMGGPVMVQPPPAATPRKSGGGPLIAVGILAVVGIGGAIAFFATRDGGAETEASAIPLPSSTVMALGTTTGGEPVADPSLGASAEPETSAAPTAQPPPHQQQQQQPPPKRGENIDYCCARAEPKKKPLCRSIAASVKNGSTPKQNGLTQMRAQGIKCN